jgi:hypothetical protein
MAANKKKPLIGNFSAVSRANAWQHWWPEKA